MKSGKSADAVAEYTGRIRQVNFEAGKYVGRGAVLAIFDQAETENAAKVNLASAGKSFELTQKNLEKTKKSLKSELGRGDESAKILVNAARIQREQAELQLEQARIAFGKTIIRAPISGTIVSKNINVNDYVTVDQVIAQISGGGKLEASISLNAEQIKRIKKGDEVDIVISERLAKGKIVSLSSVAGSNERFDVKVQSEKELNGEANRSAKIILTLELSEEKPNSFFVPLEAVTIGQRKSEIFVVEDGKAKTRKIKIGNIIGSKVEIIEGLNTGDEVIIKNGRNLQNEQEVNVKT